MSRVINIKGQILIQNIELAEEAINELRLDITIENNKFVFNKYDAYDRINESKKKDDLVSVEGLYTKKFNLYLETLAEEERLKIEEQKRIVREEKEKIIIENAKKNGYKIEKKIQKDNTIKLILIRRDY